jgi:hypothetical protein
MVLAWSYVDDRCGGVTGGAAGSVLAGHDPACGGDGGLRLPREYLASGNVWIHSIGARPRGTHPYLGVHLKDGCLVEGPAHSFALDDEGNRDLALARPIRITAATDGRRPSVAEPRPTRHPGGEHLVH